MKTIWFALSIFSLSLFAVSGLAACSSDSNDAGEELFLGTSSDPVLISTACQGALPSDPMTIGDLTIEGDTLKISVSFSGGCEDHQFAVCWNGQFATSDPPQVSLEPHHNANGDNCEAAINRDVLVDLTPLREAYDPGPPGTISISVAGGSSSVDYSY